MNRRRFLSTAAAWGVAGPTLVNFAHGAGQAAPAARVALDFSRVKATLDRRLLGSFLEHIGRAIYGGIFEPGAKSADAHGFRRDTLDEVRSLGVPIVRYPGGNFVSGYHWQDGVGPREKRPQVLDRAWNSLETNEFGVDEFAAWCRLAGAEPLLAVNLGSGSAEEAAALVEYCNLPDGTKWSELRRQNGHAEPHNVRTWCLGNEMDGPWQIGHMSASEYGRKAADAARQMRVVDRDLRLVACGSSGPFMPTYLEWDRQMLELCYADVDAISLHRYFDNSRETGGDTRVFLALNLALEEQIRQVSAVCEYVRGRLRSKKRLWLSFDEWNVWYRDRDYDGRRQKAPHLIEEVYNLEDALLVGGILNSLLRNAEVTRIGCLAQLVNVIAPLMTNAEGVLRQTIYHPYAWALASAKGVVLNAPVESTTYDIAGAGAVPYLDVAATYDETSGECLLLILNRDLNRPHELAIDVAKGSLSGPLKRMTLAGPDLKATNTFDSPNRVTPEELPMPKMGDRVTLEVPPHSYSMVLFGKSSHAAH